MDLKTAKALRPGSTFYSPSPNTHDKSGWRLQVDITDGDKMFITCDEWGYRSAWPFNRVKKDIAASRIDTPSGATDPEAVLTRLRTTGVLA